MSSAGFIIEPYRPRRWFANGHVQTIAGNFLPRADSLPAGESELVEVAPGNTGRIANRIASEVLCVCHWQPERAERLTTVLVHGLEGSSASQYIVGNANKLWRAGMNVIRMNMRNCGGTERLSPTLYHSGLSGDVLAVAQHFVARYRLQSIAFAGYSMGGNLVLKAAGELLPGELPELKAVVGVSPAVDLAASANALHEPLNRIYERRFLKNLMRRFRHKAGLFPEAFDWSLASGIRTLRAFDERITSFYSGFDNADDYYFRAAAARVLDRITVPTLILHALDDPFIRLTAATREVILSNPAITLLETRHGGHCAFLSKPQGATGDDGYWAEATLLRFLEAHRIGASERPPERAVRC